MAVPLIATLAPVGISLLGQGFSALMNARANRRAEEMINRRARDLESALRMEQHRDFLDTEEGLGILERLRTQMAEATRRNERDALRASLTPEAAIATQDAATRNYARALTDLAGYGQQRRDRNVFRYRGLLSDLYDRQFGLQRARAASWGQMGQNFQGVGGTMLDAFMTGWPTGTGTGAGRRRKLPPIDPATTPVVGGVLG